jgi:hypothetical protein
VYISQIIRYSRDSAQQGDFLDRIPLLMQKLLKQGYDAPKLKSSLQKFGVFNLCQHELVQVPVWTAVNDVNLYLLFRKKLP